MTTDVTPPDEERVVPGHEVAAAHLVVLLAAAQLDLLAAQVEDVGGLPPGHPLQGPALVWLGLRHPYIALICKVQNK